MIPFERLNFVLNNAIKEISSQAKTFVAFGASGILAGEMKYRIFTKGQDSSNNSLGKYSTQEAYFTKEQFSSKSKFKNKGKTKKPTKSTMYFGDGYEGLRKVQGKKVDNKNLNYTGELKNSFTNGKQGGDAVVGFTNIEGSNKRRYAEDSNKSAIFQPTKQELTIVNTYVVEELNSILINAFKNL